MTTRPTMLIAEDDVNIQDLLTAVFSQYFTLIQVSDGESAIEKLSAQAVSVALIDINIPLKNGLQVLTSIQKISRFPRPATVMLSGDNSNNTVSRAYDAGADLFISKPFDLLSLQKEVINLTLQINQVALA